jgi:1,2-diacylglycerol 3-beta-galactosyltransferase
MTGSEQTKHPHILFLFSDTGGGHRSATEAVIEALDLEYGQKISTEMVDFFLYAPEPFRRLPSLYPQMVRAPHVWGLGYRLSNGQKRAELMAATTWPYIRNAIRRMIASHPSDLIVMLHPLILWPALRALGEQRPPVITIVTDLVTTHAFWYDKRTDLCLVPTEEARRRAIKWSVNPEKVHVTGLPVANRFCQPPGNRHELRARLGWPQDKPMVVIVGGGEGMGPIEETAVAIARSGLNTGLAIICGRNETLRQALNQHVWPQPTFIYGFVRNMPEFMGAADVLVTKAGPGTVTEALNAGLPIILYSHLPGQEDGNITFITESGAGVWAPKASDIVAALRTWLKNPIAREKAASVCRQLARPQAAQQIAQILAQYVGISTK